MVFKNDRNSCKFRVWVRSPSCLVPKSVDLHLNVECTLQKAIGSDQFGPETRVSRDIPASQTKPKLM